jgi:hypothetical protein
MTNPFGAFYVEASGLGADGKRYVCRASVPADAIEETQEFIAKRAVAAVREAGALDPITCSLYGPDTADHQS